MANKKKIKGKLPKFNFYWIYGIVAVILISINLFNPVNTGILKSNYSEFKSFIDNKQVRKVEVINKREARVYIFPDQLDQPPHKDKNIPKKVYLADLIMAHIIFLIFPIMKLSQPI